MDTLNCGKRKKILVILNTVDTSIEFYQTIKKQF